MAADQVVLHIGTHKTGTTSLQHFLHDHPDLLAAVDATYPAGMVIAASHSELPLLALRSDLTWPARLRFPETQQPAWLDAARDHVEQQIASCHTGTIIFSHEDLSYARFDEELDLLRHLLADLPARVILSLRERSAFLRSYGDQLEATGFALSTDPSSFAYVEADSWLADYDSLTAAYRRRFGASSVTLIDYDDELRRHGSVIPAFAALLGLAPASLPKLDGYFLNRSGVNLRPTEEQLASIRRMLAEQAR